MAGRYPQNASREFIRLLKQLNSNAISNEIEIENLVVFCKADLGSRPYRRDGRQGKRTHVTLKLMPKQKKASEAKKKK